MISDSVNPAARKRRWQAIILMLVSALSFSCMQLAIKKSGVSGEQPLMEQAFFRNLFSLLFVIPPIIKKKLAPFGHREAQPYLLIRSITGYLAILCFFYASNHAAIADANVLNKLSPAVVMLLSVLLLKERVTLIQILSLLLSFAGTCVVCGPAMNSSAIAVTAAILSAVFGGIAHTFVALLKDKADPEVVIFHFSAFSVFISALGMIKDFVLPRPEQLIMLALIGVFGSLGQITLTFSYKLAPASQVSIFNYTGIVWSMLLGVMFLGEAPKLETVFGGILITLASVLSALLGERITNTKG